MPDIMPQSSPEDTTFSINIPPSKEITDGDTSVLNPLTTPQSEEEISIYTMPKEFVGAKGKRKKADTEILKGYAAETEAQTKATSSNGRTKLIIGIIILILFVGAGGVAGYFMFIKQGAVSPNTSSPPPPSTSDKPVEEPPPVPSSQTQEEPEKEPLQDISVVLSGDLIQKPVVSYNDRGMKTTEAVLSLEKEKNVNYSIITINDYIVSEKHEYFAYVAGAPYEIQLRGEAPKGKGVLTITYSEDLLKTLDIIPADLRIGYMPFSRLKEALYRKKTDAPEDLSIVAENPAESSEISVQEDEDGEIDEEIIDDTISAEPDTDPISEEQDGSAVDIGEEEEVTAFSSSVIVWDILKAQDLDDEIRSISSVLEEIYDGIYAIVPMNINDMIDLPYEPEETPAPPINDEIVPAADTDTDDLSDREELLYGTSPLTHDSDSDGYNDGLEVINLYSPARGDSVRLAQDSQFSKYTNTAEGYSFLKPQQFFPAELDQNKPGDIIVTSPEKEAIVMNVENNPGDLPLQEWLVSISPAISVSEFESFTTKGGFNVLVAPQKTTYYISLPISKSVLVVSYTAPGEYSYITTLRMIIESIT